MPTSAAALPRERAALHLGDPFAEQMRHFVAVIEGVEAPLCSAADGMRSLATTLAVTRAGESGGVIALGD